jgi:hypothetical protein
LQTRRPAPVSALPAGSLARVPQEPLLWVAGRRVPQVRIGPRGAWRRDGPDLFRDDPRPGRARLRAAGGRRRQHFDLRPWFEAGRLALENQDICTRLEDLERSLHTRRSRLRPIATATGNVPAHNPRFPGRETEMRVLHEADKSSRSSSGRPVGSLRAWVGCFSPEFGYNNEREGTRCRRSTRVESQEWPPPWKS